MTPEQLQAIRARLDAATPHPWSIRRWKGDDELISHAPTDLHALLDEVERLTALTEAAKEQNPCRLIDVGDGGMSRERAEADAFNRGIRAGREQIVSYLNLQAAVFTMNVEQMGKNIRTMKFPVDK